MKNLCALLLCLMLPLVAPAQERPVRLGVVDYGNELGAGTAAYLAALRELGYVEGGNLLVERRVAQGEAARFPALVDELARSRVDLLFTWGHDIAKVAKDLAPQLAVVTAGSEDPVLSGLVASLAKPGGNITGVTFMSPEHAPKRLEILKDAVPGLRRVAVVWDPGHVDTYYAALEQAARSIGLELRSLELRSAAGISTLAAALKGSGAQAVFIVPGRLTNFRAREIAAAALGAGLPAMGAYASQAHAGCLLAYGADIPDLIRRAAAQSARIFKGARAGELPVEQASRFLLVVNKVTARALGVSVPNTVLLRADEVIE